MNIQSDNIYLEMPKETPFSMPPLQFQSLRVTLFHWLSVQIICRLMIRWKRLDVDMLLLWFTRRAEIYKRYQKPQVAPNIINITILLTQIIRKERGNVPQAPSEDGRNPRTL